MKFYKTHGLDALKRQLIDYKNISIPCSIYPVPESYPMEEKKPMKITVFSDLELHDDGTLHLDGISVRNSALLGDGIVTCIRSENVLEFLESAIKLHSQLKKKGLLPKPAKEPKP